MKSRKIISGILMSALLASILMVMPGSELKSQKVRAAAVTYADFYNTLPANNINLTNTFNFINPTPSTGTNTGATISSSRTDTAVITQDKTWQFGGVWYQNPIDMTKDFSMLMYVNLGNKWGNGDGNGTSGADGITFTIQGNGSTASLGANGAGLGAYSKDSDTSDPYNSMRNNFISKAMVLEFDSFYNNKETYTNDNGTPNFGNGGSAGSKFYGHLDLTRTPSSGSTFYKTHTLGKGSYFRNAYYDDSTTNSTGTTTYYSQTQGDANGQGNENLMDGRWRKVAVSWSASSRTLTYNVAGYDPIVYTFSSASDVTSAFGGTTVYWGLTGSTGAYTNLQQAAIFELPDQTVKTFTKQVRNVTAGGSFSSSAAVKTGDVVEYQVELAYPSASNSLKMTSGVVTDPLASGLTYVDGSLSVTNNGTAVSSAVWNSGTISLGDIAAGSDYVLTYRATVGATGTLTNTATFTSKYTNPVSASADVWNGDLTIKKTDQDGNALKGAVFSVTGPDGTSQTVDMTNTASATLDYLPEGTYTIKETSPPDGYAGAQPQTVTISPGTGQTVTFQDTLLAADLVVTKTGESSSTKLSGAVFSLYKDESCTMPVTDSGGDALTETTGADGTATFSSLPYGTYYLLETKAAAGYQLYGKAVEVVIDSSTVNDGTVNVTLSDHQLPALPDAGGSGTWLPIVGLGLAAGALLIKKIFRKKQKDSLFP